MKSRTFFGVVTSLQALNTSQIKKLCKLLSEDVDFDRLRKQIESQPPITEKKT